MNRNRSDWARIAVAGHRVLAETAKVLGGIDTVLSRIGGKRIRVLSSLAEGADRLVVSRAQQTAGAMIVAVLPLPLEEYARDFSNPDSRKEFDALLSSAHEVVQLPPPWSRPESYVAAAKYSLDRADLLLAIWDGQPSQGVGGTGDVVSAARARGLAVAWVHAGNRKPGSMEPTTLGPSQGEVSFERWPS